MREDKMEFLKEKTNDDLLRRKVLGKLSLGSFFKKLFLFSFKSIWFLLKEYFLYIKNYKFSLKAYIAFSFYVFGIMWLIHVSSNGISEYIEAYALYLLEITYYPLVFLSLFFGKGLWLLFGYFLLSGAYIYLALITVTFFFDTIKKYITPFIEEKMISYLTIGGYKKRKERKKEQEDYRRMLEQAEKNGIDIYQSKFSTLRENAGLDKKSLSSTK